MFGHLSTAPHEHDENYGTARPSHLIEKTPKTDVRRIVVAGATGRVEIKHSARCARPYQGAREDSSMPDVTVVFWRDIPAQVIVGKGRRGAKAQLPERFEQAIDRAAMKSGAA